MPDDEGEFFRQATIVLDTNVLLAPYKLSAAAREDALRAIESSAERLWLPHQVGVEFYRNHASNRDLRAKAYEAAIDQTAKFEQLVTKHLGTGKTHEDLRKEIARVVRDSSSSMKTAIEQLRIADKAITAFGADDVLKRIEAALGSRVAPPPDSTTIRNRTEEFTSWRAPSRTPPGYKDQGKSGTVASAGDFLIWAEILAHAAANNLDVLFVTEDGKDDWWEVVDGQRRPHRALVLEFQRTTGPGRAYHQVSLDTFVRLATKAAGDEADQSTLNEIVAVRKEAEESESRNHAFANWLASIEQIAPGWEFTAEHLKQAFPMTGVDWDALELVRPETRRAIIARALEKRAAYDVARRDAVAAIGDDITGESNDA